MALSELLKNLDPNLADALSEVTRGLRREFDEKLAATRAELGLEAAPAAGREEPEPAAPPDAEMLDPIEELKHAVVAIDGAGSQGEILAALVAGCARFASRCAVFLLREGRASGWNSHGFSLSDDDMRGVSLDVEPDSAWQKLSDGEGSVALDAGECAALTQALGGEAAEMGLLIPFVLNNQTAAGIYCDRLAGEAPPNVAALQLVTFVASQVLENLPVRDRSSTSTLRLAASAPAVPAAPAAEPEPETPEVEAPAVDEAEQEAGGLGGYEMAVPGIDEPESPDGLFEPEPASEAPPTEPEMAEAPAEFAEPEPPGEAPAAGFPAAVEPPAIEPPAPAAETASTATAPVDEEPEPPALLSDATTQVVPPTDLEGPGWAFTGASSATPETGDEAQHEEARRLARLLVTEVKLYNEELVEKGRQKGNLYSVLREDIDRSRQIFEDRIAEDVRSHSDYFHDALVRILAGGDPTVLGA